MRRAGEALGYAHDERVVGEVPDVPRDENRIAGTRHLEKLSIILVGERFVYGIRDDSVPIAFDPKERGSPPVPPSVAWS